MMISSLNLEINPTIRFTSALLTLDQTVKKVFLKIIDHLTWIFRYTKNSLHTLIGKFIFPAASLYANKENRSLVDHVLKEYKKLGMQDSLIMFSAKDGAQISGILLKPKQESQLLMIYFLGNADNTFSQHPNLRQKIADRLGLNVLMINYRDNYPSSGKFSKNGLLDDATSTMQYALNLGYKKNQIILHGSSLGGAVAAHVASLYPEVNLCIDRSFSKLSIEIEKLIGLWIFGKIAAIFAKALDWELDSLSSWERVLGRKWIISNPFDGIIKRGARIEESVDKDSIIYHASLIKRQSSNPNLTSIQKMEFLKLLEKPSEADLYIKNSGLQEHCFDLFSDPEDLAFYLSQIKIIKEDGLLPV